ncbi:MAG: hypothetical protein WD069_15655 [Planctomycetales bacterium]
MIDVIEELDDPQITQISQIRKSGRDENRNRDHDGEIIAMRG